MSVDRTTILKEPGVVTFGGAQFYSQGDITVSIEPTQFSLDSSMFGSLAARDSDRQIKIAFTPVGEFESLAVLNPFASMLFGASLFGATDSPLVIYTKSGRSLTIHNVAVTNPPGNKFAHNSPIFDAVELTGLVKKDTDPATANAYYTLVESGATYPGDTAFDPTKIYTLGYNGSFAAAGNWSSFGTEAGFSVDYSASLSPTVSDGQGTIDMTLENFEVTVSASPQGILQSDVDSKRNFQGTGNPLGGIKSDSTDLVITNVHGGDLVHFRLYNAQLATSPVTFSSSSPLVGEVTWKADAEFSSGVKSPLFYLGAAAPV